MENLLYLDYAATTPVADEVIEKMLEYMGAGANFGNAASRSHAHGWRAEQAVEHARDQLATALNADVREIVWTSGATEANNLAIKSAIKNDSRDGLLRRHVLTSATEHKAVIDPCLYLQSQGYEVSFIKPDENGVITADAVAKELQDHTLLVSIMHVNNETGVVNDIAEIGKLLTSHPAVFHVDAAQSLGKIACNPRKLNADLMSFSAHKLYGPKGIGALYVGLDAKHLIAPQIHGGGHEQGMRSGTLPVHQIVGFGAAAELAQNMLAEEEKRVQQLKQSFCHALEDVDGIVYHADHEKVVPNIINVGFRGVDADTMISGLDGISISSGSACTSASVEPSHVLLAMGVDRELALSSLRFSFGRCTTEEQVKMAAGRVKEVYSTLSSAVTS